MVIAYVCRCIEGLLYGFWLSGSDWFGDWAQRFEGEDGDFRGRIRG